MLSGEFLAAYAAENDNRPSRGVNGTDQMMMMRVAVDRAGAVRATAPVPLPAAEAAVDPAIQEGYASAAGLGLVLLVSGAGGLVTVGLVIVRALSGVLG